MMRSKTHAQNCDVGKLEAVIEAENLADGSTVRIPTGCSGATADKSKYLAARVVEPRGPR